MNWGKSPVNGRGGVTISREINCSEIESSIEVGDNLVVLVGPTFNAVHSSVNGNTLNKCKTI